MTSNTGFGALTPPPSEEEAGELFGGLSSLLWRERELLGHVLDTLTTQRVLFETGQPRWFVRTDLAVRAAARAMQEHDVARAVETDRIVRRYGLPGDTPLSRLAAVAPEPWPAILQVHRAALRDLTDEIEEVADGSRELLRHPEAREARS